MKVYNKWILMFLFIDLNKYKIPLPKVMEFFKPICV